MRFGRPPPESVSPVPLGAPATTAAVVHFLLYYFAFNGSFWELHLILSI